MLAQARARPPAQEVSAARAAAGTTRVTCGAPLVPPGLSRATLEKADAAPPRNAPLISLFMHGGPSHVDLTDPKPELTRRDGADYPGEVVYSFVNRASKKLLGSPWKFAKHGHCGTEISELLPQLASIVDDVCLIRSMHTGHNGHEVSIRYFHSGIPAVTGRPTMGAWLTYALGWRDRRTSRPTWC